MPVGTFDGARHITQAPAARRKVFFTGATALVEGQPLYYDNDRGTPADVEGKRGTYVELASETNCPFFAGVTTRAYIADALGQAVEIYPPGSYCNVQAKASCTVASTILHGVAAANYADDQYVVGPPIALALQTMDRGTVQGLVFCELLPQMKLLPVGAAGDDGPSPSLWGSCPLLPIMLNPGLGFHWFDDFLRYAVSDASLGATGWVLANATTGTGVLADAVGGVMKLDAGASTADQGVVQFQAAGGGTTGEIFKPVAGKHLWFEARVKITNVGNQFFCGLANIDTSVFATGANSTTDHIGFEMNATSIAAAAGSAAFYGEKAGARNTLVAYAGTFVTTEWTNIGFYVNGVTSVTPYWNGVPTTDVLATANIPILEMVPTLVCIAEGTTQPTVEIDWIRAVQLR